MRPVIVDSMEFSHGCDDDKTALKKICKCSFHGAFPIVKNMHSINLAGGVLSMEQISVRDRVQKTVIEFRTYRLSSSRLNSREDETA